jgi:hypothetical protein
MAGPDGTTTRPGSYIERAGVAFLASRARDRRVVATDAVHVLNDAERASLRRIERWAVGQATLTGALSGLLCAIPTIALAPPDWTDAGAWLRYWTVVMGVTAVVSVLEIAWLYRLSLIAVHDLAEAAGFDLGDPGHADDPTSALWALARAALEVPNPPTAVPGIDPLREASKLRILVASSVYKLKVALSGYLLKALLRRALGRVATRAVLELIAVPVTAAWDGLLTWLIVREARIRVVGPSAAAEMAAHLIDPHRLGPAGDACAVRAIGAAIVRTEDPHPNLVALLVAVRRASGVGHLDELDDTARFLRELAALAAGEQAVVLRLLVAATIIDGRIAWAEGQLLAEAFALTGRTLDRPAIERLRRALVAGDPIDKATLEAVAH